MTIIQFRKVTIKSIYREAIKEINKMYILTKGGSDLMVSTDKEERQLFDDGMIDEMPLLDFHTWAKNRLNEL